MKVDWFTESASSEPARDIGRLVILVALALLGPFVAIFPEPFQAWEPIEPTVSLFSSVLWALTIVSDSQLHAAQVTFALLPVLTSPVLLFAAVIRVWFAVSIVAHRRGIWKTADLAVSGSLMFVSTMLICVLITFNLSLPGLPWNEIIPVPSGMPLNSACYPFPVLYLAGLLGGSRKSQHPQPASAPEDRVSS